MAKNYNKKGADGYYRENVPTGKYLPSGKPQYKVIRAKSQKGLKEKVDAFRQNQHFGISSENMTVDDWFCEWKKTYKNSIKETTLAFYDNLYNKNVHPEIGGKKISSIKELDCQKILTAMEESGLSHRTVDGVRKLMKGLFEKAVSNRYIAFNPAAQLNAGGKKRTLRRALTIEEREKYLAACKEDEFGLYASFLYWFGLRRGECLALMGSDIENGVLKITKQFTFPDNNQPVLSSPKTAAGVREIPIPDMAKDYIDFENLPLGYIFTNSDGEPLTCHELTRRWNKFIKTALGADTDITEHFIRHNYATMLCEMDIPLKAMQTYCGHENIETTFAFYQHYSEELKKQADEKIKKLGQVG